MTFTPPLRLLLVAALVAAASYAAAQRAASAQGLRVAAPQAARAIVVAKRSLVAQPERFLPFETRYAQVDRPAPVFATLEDARLGRAAHARGGEHTWVSVRGQVELGGQVYYRVYWHWADSGWMAASDLRFNQTLSPLRGVELAARDLSREVPAIVVAEALNVRAEPGDLRDASRVGRLQRYDLVTVVESRWVGGARWHRIGWRQWVHGDFIRLFAARPRPAGVGAQERWLDVNLSQQVVLAMEGDKPVYGALVATGRPGRETVTGLHRIWVKLRTAPMRGPHFTPSYDYADVPYVMYFSGSFGLHGVYHHDAFGMPRSSGCVNLSPFDARWLFEWAGPQGEGRQTLPSESEPGTWVYVAY